MVYSGWLYLLVQFCLEGGVLPEDLGGIGPALAKKLDAAREEGRQAVLAKDKEIENKSKN